MLLGRVAGAVSVGDEHASYFQRGARQGVPRRDGWVRARDATQSLGRRPRRGSRQAQCDGALGNRGGRAARGDDPVPRGGSAGHRSRRCSSASEEKTRRISVHPIRAPPQADQCSRQSHRRRCPPCAVARACPVRRTVRLEDAGIRGPGLRAVLSRYPPYTAGYAPDTWRYRGIGRDMVWGDMRTRAVADRAPRPAEPGGRGDMYGRLVPFHSDTLIL
ncbi:hypothetical protein EMIHUDRAFT_451242, partial [Emiliania huxleyi CCMP1516]|uniref:Uncharacterized protein n=2 Tax=Emiliania huxleyi TaxID=2903 RepID=A0A0D3J5S1_EMIH1